ncbi:TetR/AcrR family transcriptional regulator [Actinomyces minihominis]|uniref:TetR/AcrR family transcriptional regulator n=1 Tax=Actinomyces minihominis TaxID=2002838 RepID=UPI000C06D2FB|nr:TetR/AcrR family transcriptional regulator [Actinomyces minihominis]
MTSTRERLLDAYEALIDSVGERRASLDAVARAAGTSKGGLLYHFPSKAALVTGVCDRLENLVRADIEVMRTAPEGAARYYVRTSRKAGTALDTSLLAITRLQDAGYPEAHRVARQVDEEWLDALSEQIPDPATAYVVKLIGDGAYYESLRGDSDAPPRKRPTTDDILSVVDRLTTRQ